MEKIYNDIIVGISTAFAQGAISIVRLSGHGCIDLVNKHFKGKNLNKVASHTISYGHIIDDDNNMLDEVLVSVFKAPKTYTTEDVVEINCHGGLFVTNQIYECLVLAGARPAEPGEFTKRAFLGGRIDLTQAESVMDMIDAENKNAVKLACEGLQGSIRKLIEGLRERLLNIVATIDVNIDYPEYYDVHELTTNEIEPNIKSLYNELVNILNDSKSAKILKNGINTAIIGKPNVGKSSLLNGLLEENKAIVTAIPGTTRDIIEAKINLGSLTLNLIDTAGIRNTEDIVEQIGFEKSKEQIDKADFVLLVFDGSVELDDQDKQLLKLTEDKKRLIVINKSDLEMKIKPIDDAIIISANNTADILRLKNKIKEIFNANNIQNKDITYISNARQIDKMNLAKNELKEALTEIADGAFIDFIEIHLRAAWMYLGEIIGEASTDSLINELFSKFCLGK